MCRLCPRIEARAQKYDLPMDKPEQRCCRAQFGDTYDKANDHIFVDNDLRQYKSRARGSKLPRSRHGPGGLLPAWNGLGSTDPILRRSCVRLIQNGLWHVKIA